MKYLVFPHVRVQTANIFGASFLIGGPPVFAAYGLGQALCFHLKGGAKVTGTVLIHHDREALGQSFYGVFSPQQRRGAAFSFRPNDTASGGDYSSKNKHALSLQPVASAHMLVSFIWEVENVVSASEAEKFLHSAHFSGGTITGHGEITLEDSLDEAFERIPNGYIVMDRRDLLENTDKNQAQLMVEALEQRPDPEQNNTWLTAACVGYSAITPFEKRGGVREGYKHAFAEPLVGMSQYCSLRQWRQQERDWEETLWRPVWLEDRLGTFVLRQEESEETEESEDGM